MPQLLTKEPRGFTAITHLMSKLVRYDEIDGERYLVVPVVLITEGVHNNVLYTREELSKFPVSWNGVPVPVFHPDDNGMPISANNPEIARKQNIGQLFNCEGFVNSAGLYGIRGEAWLSETKTLKLAPEVLQLLNANKPIEVSTGLFSEDEVSPGAWHGEDYERIARNIRSDHLAVLPGGKGACSWDDGAGMPRNNSAVEQTPNGLKRLLAAAKAFLSANEVAHETINDQLNATLQEAYPMNPDTGNGAWVMAVFDDHFIYERYQNQELKLYRQDYTVQDDAVTVSDAAPVEVRKTVSFVAVNSDGDLETNSPNDGATMKGVTKMDKSKLVNALIANAATAWTEEDRESLMALDDAVLAKMAPVANEEPPADEEPPEEPPAEEPPADEEPATLAQYLESAPSEIRDSLRAMHANHEAQKAALVDVLVANKRCTFSKAQLQAKELDELKGLASLAGSEVPAPSKDFSGRSVGEPDMTTNEDADEPLAIPSLSKEAS